MCKENYIASEANNIFWMYCKGHDNIRKDLHSLISQTDANFVNLTDHDKIMNLLKLNNDDTAQIIAKYTHIMFRKRKDIVKPNICY